MQFAEGLEAKTGTGVMKKAVTFYSEGCKLSGDLYLPEGLRPTSGARVSSCATATRASRISTCPTMPVSSTKPAMSCSRSTTRAGEPARGRAAVWRPTAGWPTSRQRSRSLACSRKLHPDRLGIYGTSYGGATVVWVGAVDPRVKCIVSVVGVGHGRRWMRSVRRPDEWHDLLDRAKADREKRVLDGQSAMADRSQILLPDRQSAELGCRRAPRQSRRRQ